MHFRVRYAHCVERHYVYHHGLILQADQGNLKMKVKQCVCVFAAILMISGCGNAERRANKSVAKVNSERLSLIKNYEKCIKKVCVQATALLHSLNASTLNSP